MTDREGFTPEIVQAQEQYREAFYQSVVLLGSPLFSSDEISEMLDRIGETGGVLAVRLEYDHYSNYPYPFKIHLPSSIQTRVDVTYPGVSTLVSRVTFWPDAARVDVEDLGDNSSIAEKKDCITVVAKNSQKGVDACKDSEEDKFCIGKNLHFHIDSPELIVYSNGSNRRMTSPLEGKEIADLAEFMKSHATYENAILAMFRQREIGGL